MNQYHSTASTRGYTQTVRDDDSVFLEIEAGDMIATIHADYTKTYHTVEDIDFYILMYKSGLEAISRDNIVKRYRDAIKLQARWKQVVSDYAQRYPEFERINATSRRKGVSILEQFRELVQWKFS